MNLAFRIIAKVIANKVWANVPYLNESLFSF